MQVGNKAPDLFTVSTHTPSTAPSKSESTSSKPDPDVSKSSAYSSKIESSGEKLSGQGFVERKTEKSIAQKIAGYVKFEINPVLGKIVPKILSYERHSSDDLKKMRSDFATKNSENTPVRFEVSTKGANLDAMLIAPKGENPLAPRNPNVNLAESNPNKDKHVVISLHGLMNRYEEKLGESKELADKSGAHVLVFNYQGRGASTGKDSSHGDDWVNNTIAMVAYLKSTGIPEENITILGHSMGGAVGTQAAAQFEKVKLVSDRSISSLSNATKECANNATDNKIGKVFMAGLGKIAASAVGASYNLNAERAIRQNPDLQNRAIFISAQHDEVVSENASIGHTIERKNNPLQEKAITHIQIKTETPDTKANKNLDWDRLSQVNADYKRENGLRDQLQAIDPKLAPSLTLNKRDYNESPEKAVIDKNNEFVALWRKLDGMKANTTDAGQVRKLLDLQRGIEHLLTQLPLQHYKSYDAHNESLLTSLNRIKDGESQTETLLNFVNPNRSTDPFSDLGRVAHTFSDVDFGDLDAHPKSKMIIMA